MESQDCLGLYIARDTATAIHLRPRSKHGGEVSCFSVSTKGQEQGGFQTLADLIAKGCTEREWKFTEVAVALDCAMFMQHSVHSGFSDPKQIVSTVKFDTEEVLATDIANVALAFEVISTNQAGAELAVFTAERKILTEILSALQQHGFDPLTMEPDVSCLSRFIARKADSIEPEPAGTLFAALSRRSGYLIAPPATASEGNRKGMTLRTFMVGATQNRSELLARESLVTIAMAEDGEPIKKIRVFDSAGVVDCRQFSERLGTQATAMDLYQAAGIAAQFAADGVDPVDCAIAYGATMAHSEKAHIVDFRSDFSPFQGKKMRLHKALKAAAVSVTILLIAVGLYFQTQLFSANKDKNNLHVKFAKNYAEVTLDKLPANATIKKAVADLEKLKRRIEAEKKGLIADKTSISSKLTLVLAAFNKCSAQTNLNISAITITSNDISIAGDTSSRQNRQKIFDTVRSSGLDILQENYNEKGGREYFSIKVAPKI